MTAILAGPRPGSGSDTASPVTPAVRTPTVCVATVAAELRRLRKGRGAQAGQSADRVGPALRTLCGIAEDASPVEVINRVAEWLRDASTALPDDLRISAWGAFGLHAQAPSQLYYQERVQWVAQQLDRDPRTARRRVDRAITGLAELAGQREHKLLVDLDGYIGQHITLAWSPSGIKTAHQTTRCCRLLALAHPLDRDGRLAIVDLVDEPGTVAIPTTRIVSVTAQGDSASRVSDLPAAQPVARTGTVHTAREERRT